MVYVMLDLPECSFFFFVRNAFLFAFHVMSCDFKAKKKKKQKKKFPFQYSEIMNFFGIFHLQS